MDNIKELLKRAARDIEEIKVDVKEVKAKADATNLIMARNTTSLELHEKRTTMSEERITTVERWLLGSLFIIVMTLVTKLFLSS